MEDDVKVLVSQEDLLNKVNMDRINIVFYQKYLKYQLNFVGAQGIFIPYTLICYYIDKLLNSKSIHFDRWNGKYLNIYYAYNPKEGGVEYERASINLKGRIRKGLKL